MTMFQNYSYIDLIWLSIGFIGQFMFSMRFIIQWLVSESKKKSIIPNAFWYFSICGGLILLAYAIYKRDLVFMVGQAMGIFIYARNIYLIHTHRTTLQESQSTN